MQENKQHPIKRMSVIIEVPYAEIRRLTVNKFRGTVSDHPVHRDTLLLRDDITYEELLYVELFYSILREKGFATQY